MFLGRLYVYQWMTYLGQSACTLATYVLSLRATSQKEALCASASGAKLPAAIFFKERGVVLGRRVRRGLDVPCNVRSSVSNGERLANEGGLPSLATLSV